MNYQEARRLAQEKANETNLDFGIEKVWDGFRVFMLPNPENRFGFELRCEVVKPDTF